MMITADHESVVMQQIRRERFRQFCEGFGSLRSPCGRHEPQLTLRSLGRNNPRCRDPNLSRRPFSQMC